MKQPSQLQLGVDIPISLQRVEVGGGPDSNCKAFLLVVPDIDAGGYRARGVEAALFLAAGRFTFHGSAMPILV